MLNQQATVAKVCLGKVLCALMTQWSVPFYFATNKRPVVCKADKQKNHNASSSRNNGAIKKRGGWR